METILKDVRYGVRVLTHSPGFTAAAVLSLALGIGAVTAIFSVVHGVLLRPLPYPDPDRIVQVWQVNEDTRRGQVSDPNFEDWRDENRSFAALAQYATSTESVAGGAEAVRANVTYVSRGFFDVMGVPPAAGRTFVADETREGGNLAIIVSQAFWTRAFGGATGFDGKILRSEGRAFQVVGVMPAGFAFPDGNTDIWVPREILPRNPHRTGHNWLVVGRIKPHVALAQARDDMSALARSQVARYGDDIQLTDIALVPLGEQTVGGVRRPLLVLLGAVVFLLLVACANVANLMLAHLNARRRELAVRSALGASAARLNRQLLTEAVLLAAAGGALGFLLAPWALGAMLALDPGQLPRREQISVDPQVGLFTLAVIAAVAILLGFAAGTRSASGGLNEALLSGGRSHAGGRGEERFRMLLVAAQVALSLMLLVGAALMGQTLYRLISVDPGYRTSGALVMDLALPYDDNTATWRQTAQFYDRLIGRLQSVPGVERVGGINRFPLAGGVTNGTFLEILPNDRLESLEDFQRLARDSSRTGTAEFRVTSADYFSAMGIPLRRGRLFDDRDAPDGPHVAVVSESLANRRWPGRDPIGRQIQFGNMDGDLRPFTIVGVVGDVRDRGLDREPRPTLYGFHRQRPRVIAHFSIAAATRVDPAELAPAFRQAVREMRPDVAATIATIEDLVSASFSDRRFNLSMLAAFGLSAVVLAAVGIYGVTAFWVSRRTREFGVRLALGATPGEVVRMVIGRTWATVGLGVIVGVAGALAMTRLLRTLLFGVEPTDPLAFTAATAALAIVAFIAGIVPASRAARVDPAEALRAEH
ncbi:MAG TPA: ABC transporter permease [Vicinamibacterales bacterium]|nr:ABC transporter permease [Vicinamibacterales bacterium]